MGDRLSEVKGILGKIRQKKKKIGTAHLHVEGSRDLGQVF